jgi:hypothetical protein
LFYLVQTKESFPSFSFKSDNKQLFVRQVWKDYESSKKEISKSDTPIAHLQLELFDIMRGPWDRRNQNIPFAVEKARPDGAGFYPETFTETDFGKVTNGSKEEMWMNNLATMVWTDQFGDLVVWPYSRFFKRELEPAARHLLAAAKHTYNESLKRFLKSRFVFLPLTKCSTFLLSVFHKVV